MAGLGISGLARLCSVEDTTISRLLRNIARHLVRSERLQRFSGKDLYLGIKGPKGAKIVRADVCSAIIRYYAFESDAKTEEALYAYEKFADMGMEAWIPKIAAPCNG